MSSRLPFDPDASAACLAGHFPQRPIIPGVVLLEAAIERAGLSAPLRIDQAKFLRPCPPGLPLWLCIEEREHGGVDLRIESDHGLMVSARLRRVDAGAPA